MSGEVVAVPDSARAPGGVLGMAGKTPAEDQEQDVPSNNRSTSSAIGMTKTLSISPCTPLLFTTTRDSHGTGSQAYLSQLNGSL